jgi:hypothetical protein
MFTLRYCMLISSALGSVVTFFTHVYLAKWIMPPVSFVYGRWLSSRLSSTFLFVVCPKSKSAQHEVVCKYDGHDAT